MSGTHKFRAPVAGTYRITAEHAVIKRPNGQEPISIPGGDVLLEIPAHETVEIEHRDESYVQIDLVSHRTHPEGWVRHVHVRQIGRLV